MPYEPWGPATLPKDREFYEKITKRSLLPRWEEAWRRLSLAARTVVLEKAKYAIREPGTAASLLDVPASKYNPGVLKELIDSGFLLEEPRPKRGEPDRVKPNSEAHTFVLWIRGLQRYRLLHDGGARELTLFINWAMDSYALNIKLTQICRDAGFRSIGYYDSSALPIIMSSAWHQWVADSLKTPLAWSILDAVQKAGGKLPRWQVPSLLPKARPDEVVGTLDRLVGHLALMEDLDGKSLDILVGFMPGVNKKIAASSQRRSRPPLEVVQAPRELGPTDGIFVDDLRSFLLEVATESPPIRQDGQIFAKQVDRFLSALDRLPDWLERALDLSSERRLGSVHSRAERLGFVEIVKEDSTARLTVARAGNRWLALAPAGQYEDLYGKYQRAPGEGAWSSPLDGYMRPDPELAALISGGHGRDDMGFLGSDVVVSRSRKVRDNPFYLEWKKDDALALRAAIADRFLALEPGKFYRYESFLAHHTFGKDNVVFLGLDPDKVNVGYNGQPAPRLEEVNVGLGRLVLSGLVICRLIPLGALQAATEEDGKLCIAPTHRLAAYFDRAPIVEKHPAEHVGTRVVIQPDFSVVVIGLDPAPVAELVAFCERVTRGSAAGAQTLRITRDSVIRAVGRGLTVKEIFARLERLATHDLPANVRHEIREWGGSVRTLEPATLTVLRCPDRATADRLVAALKGHSERLNDRIVALEATLTKAQRDKLLAQGLVIEGTWKQPRHDQKTRKRQAW